MRRWLMFVQKSKHQILLEVMDVLDKNRVSMFDGVSILEVAKHSVLNNAFKELQNER